ncbi:MAG: TolC family protein [Pyrinomonadaceae bacterium MAG19_C2-C3]|nr:TolC family protein [Pyrinomonadaceae bacterium MAG19_C2-C3]
MRQASHKCKFIVMIRAAILCCSIILTGALHTTAQTPTPQATPTPNAAPLPSAAEAAQDAKTPEQTATPTPSPRSQLFTLAAPRPVPPVPSLVRLGVMSDRMLTLSLNEAIRRALENNNDIDVARADVRVAEFTLLSLEGVYRPIFSVTPQITNRVSPFTQPGFAGETPEDAISTTSFSLIPQVTKQFARGGGRYDVFFDQSRTTSNLALFNPQYQQNLGVNINQPLWRDRSIDAFRRDIRIQRKRLEQTDADFRLRVIDVISQVQAAYWEIVFALRDQQNRIANVNLARENFRLTEARVAAGSAAPLARAEVQTELSTRETELLVASQNVSRAENNLKQLLLKDAMDAAWSAQIVPTDEPTLDTTAINLNDALTEARQNRPELRRLRLQTDINAIDQQFFRNQTRPRIDLQANVATGGFAGSFVNRNPTQPVFPGVPAGQIPIIIGDSNTNANAFLLQQINVLRATQGLNPVVPPNVTPPTSGVNPDIQGGFFRGFSNLLGFDNRQITVGVRIEIPFRNQTAQAQLGGALAQREQIAARTRLQEQTIETEVRNAAQEVETARRRVLTARTAREAAELQLEGERRLFENGRSTQFLLFQRENQLANSRNLELRAETDYNQALARLQRATSTTLQANNIFID